jgi:glycosyltransferase involved in cell wall biosynthesis
MSAVEAADSPTLSVVIPTYNEEDNARAIAAAVAKQCEATGESFEIIFIDNASTDRTVAILREVCIADPRVRVIVNARNFGQMRSPTHGIFQASGKAVIGICADFQDPPEMIPAFVDLWRAGNDIVLAVRETENAGKLITFGRKLAYWFVSAFGDAPIVPNATGFGLYDRKVVRTIAGFREPEPFFRGLLVETGYSLATIPYKRPARTAGKSSNSFFVLLDFALSGIASSSRKLLRAPFFIGVFTLVACFGALAIALFVALFGGHAAWWLIAALIEFNAGVALIFLGVLGDQVRLIAERTREVPLVIERERINFPRSK